jgi:hypothetical protein
MTLGKGSSDEQLVEFPKKFGCDYFLAARRRVGIVECFQDRPDGGEKVGAAFKVNMSLFEMTPKQRLSDSRRNHGARTLAKKVS